MNLNKKCLYAGGNPGACNILIYVEEEDNITFDDMNAESR